MMEHHKLCSTRPENDCGDGYEGICDCIEIYQARIKELKNLKIMINTLESFKEINGSGSFYNRKSKIIGKYKFDLDKETEEKKEIM